MNIKPPDGETTILISDDDHLAIHFQSKPKKSYAYQGVTIKVSKVNDSLIVEVINAKNGHTIQVDLTDGIMSSFS